VITSTFRFPDALDGAGVARRGAYLQDAGYPLAGDYLWELLAPASLAERVVRFAWERIASVFTRDPQTEIGRQIGALFGSATMSRDTMPLLGMGRDVPDGRFRLSRRRHLQLSWTDLTSQNFYTQVDAEAKRVAEAMGGRYVQNPLTRIFNRMITVHPLGGCAMGIDERSGVVDGWGAVFNYPGLYVADGSVMPGPTGTNPSLTIAAFADRVASRMLETWTPCAR
jgi:cholesterol oxidase